MIKGNFKFVKIIGFLCLCLFIILIITGISISVLTPKFPEGIRITTIEIYSWNFGYSEDYSFSKTINVSNKSIHLISDQIRDHAQLREENFGFLPFYIAKNFVEEQEQSSYITKSFGNHLSELEEIRNNVSIELKPYILDEGLGILADKFNCTKLNVESMLSYDELYARIEEYSEFIDNKCIMLLDNKNNFLPQVLIIGEIPSSELSLLARSFEYANYRDKLFLLQIIQAINFAGTIALIGFIIILPIFLISLFIKWIKSRMPNEKRK